MAGAKRLTPDGKHLTDDDGNLWDSSTHHFVRGPSGAGSAGGDTQVGAAPANTYKKGSKMPSQAEHGSKFGDEMRKWREAQRAEPSPAPAPSPRAGAVKKMLNEKLD